MAAKVVNLNPIFTFLEEENDDGYSSTVHVPNNIFFQKSIRRWQGVKSERLDEYMFNEKVPKVVEPNGQQL